MVSLEDLVTLLTRRAPGDLRGAPARSRGNTTDVTEMLKDEEKRGDGNGKSVAEKLFATTEAGAAAAVLEAAAAAMLKLPQRTSDAASSAPPQGEPVRSPPELPQGANKSAPPSVLPHVSTWFRDRPTPRGGGGEGDGVDDAERPLPADVRWALTWLLDSVFFSVKEPVEGLDRHPAVHALLENFLAVSLFLFILNSSDD